MNRMNNEDGALRDAIKELTSNPNKALAHLTHIQSLYTLDDTLDDFPGLEAALRATTQNGQELVVLLGYNLELQNFELHQRSGTLTTLVKEQFIRRLVDTVFVQRWARQFLGAIRTSAVRPPHVRPAFPVLGFDVPVDNWAEHLDEEDLDRIDEYVHLDELVDELATHPDLLSESRQFAAAMWLHFAAATALVIATAIAVAVEARQPTSELASTDQEIGRFQIVDRLSATELAVAAATTERLRGLVAMHLQAGAWSTVSGAGYGVEDEVAGDLAELRRRTS